MDGTTRAESRHGQRPQAPQRLGPLDLARVHLRDHVGKERDALLFPPRNGAGFLRESSSPVMVYYPARRAAGRPDLRFHDLRHTGLTYAARAGATTAELMSRAGHKTAAAALVYQHASAERDHALAAKLSRMAEGESVI